MQRVAGVKGAKAGKLSAAGLTVNGESFTASAMPARTRKPPHKTAQAGAKAADALQTKK